MSKSLLSVFLVFLLLMSFICVAYASDTGVDDTAGFLSKLLSFFNNFFDNLYEFVRGIFIPSNDFFPNQIQQLQDKVNEKMGGVGYLYDMLKSFFDGLKNTTVSTPLNFSLPDNFLFDGYKGMSIDFLASGAVYVKFLRDFANVLICLATAFVCYKKLTSFFSDA